MDTPQISIIVPVYNVEQYLPRCLDSLLKQTERKIEIICVDDGSTDGCAAILANYATKDERIRVITQANGGLSAARNAGMRVAKAEFIAFVDSDDYVEPDTYAIALKHIREGADFVCFGVQVEGDLTSQERSNHELYYKHACEGLIQLTEKHLLACDVVVWNKVYRLSLIRDHDLSFPEGLKYEDNYFFFAYCAWATHAYYTPEKCYHYYFRKDSIMGETRSGKNGYAMDFVKIAIRLYHYYNQHGFLPEKEHMMGECFFRLVNAALSYAKDASERCRMCDDMNAFLREENPGFLQYNIVPILYDILRCGMVVGVTRHKLLGLLSIRQTAKNRKYYFCGIPLWRVKYENFRKRHYFFTILPIWSEKLNVL